MLCKIMVHVVFFATFMPLIAYFLHFSAATFDNFALQNRGLNSPFSLRLDHGKAIPLAHSANKTAAQRHNGKAFPFFAVLNKKDLREIPQVFLLIY